jgi:hypothetical protein
MNKKHRSRAVNELPLLVFFLFNMDFCSKAESGVHHLLEFNIIGTFHFIQLYVEFNDLC